MKRIVKNRDPFDEIDYETLETNKFDPKKEQLIYSKNSNENTDNVKVI